MSVANYLNSCLVSYKISSQKMLVLFYQNTNRKLEESVGSGRWRSHTFGHAKIDDWFSPKLLWSDRVFRPGGSWNRVLPFKLLHSVLKDYEFLFKIMNGKKRKKKKESKNLKQNHHVFLKTWFWTEGATSYTSVWRERYFGTTKYLNKKTVDILCTINKPKIL